MKAAVSKEVLFSLIDLMVSSSAHSGGGFRATGEAWLNPQPLPPLPAANAVHPSRGVRRRSRGRSSAWHRWLVPRQPTRQRA